MDGPPGNNMTRENYGQAYHYGFDLTLRFLRSRGVPSERERSHSGRVGEGLGLEQLQDENMAVSRVNTIALNAYRRVLRSEPVWQALPDLRTKPAVNLAAIDMARILKVCCPQDRSLPEQQMKGLTPCEIARMRGVPESAIRIRLLRARRAGRQRIERMGRAYLACANSLTNVDAVRK
jgi:hypothetical protein